MIGSAFFARLDARDRALFVRLSIRERTSRGAKLFWTTLTHLGGVSFSVAAALVPLTMQGDVGIAAHHALTTLVVSHLIVQLVKRTVGRPRPSRAIDCRTLIGEPDRFSFPSGHSAAAMAVAFTYALAFPTLAAVLIPLAVLVGISRVYLGVHYPGDVLIGQLIAVLTALPIALR
ncbi:MAG TPA: phosphatase PAP2 family protein [Gemmatimonadaceae bacterium]|nr:phosphatase PAP2 family protein [Gemmatimonadaceae bacterium]